MQICAEPGLLNEIDLDAIMSRIRELNTSRSSFYRCLMITTIQLNGREFAFDLEKPLDISIPLQFNGPQPNAYGVEPARSKPCEAGDVVGDTRQGGSVNFEQYTFIPHCNGTHTECVGHITDERISVRDCLRDVIVPAVLVSVEPERIGNDLVVSKSRLSQSLEQAITYVRANDMAEEQAERVDRSDVAE